MNNIFLIFPNQLFENIDKLKDKKVFLIEHPIFFYDDKIKFNFHIQKLLLHRISMNNYYNYLLENGIDVTYVEYSKDFQFSNLIEDLKVQSLEYYYLADFILEKRSGSIDLTC